MKKCECGGTWHKPPNTYGLRLCTVCGITQFYHGEGWGTCHFNTFSKMLERFTKEVEGRVDALQWYRSSTPTTKEDKSK